MTINNATQRHWFKTFVKSLMATIMKDEVETDSDGDFPLHGETARAWVRCATREPLGVRVFALAAQGVPLRAGVLKELNEINGNDPAIRVAWHEPGSIMVDYRLFADAVSEDNLRLVIGRVLATADQIGPMLTAVYGGETPVPATALQSEQ